MKKHLITAAIAVLAVTPALAQPSVKTDTTVNVIYSADKFKVETNRLNMTGSSTSEAEHRFISETTTSRQSSETGLLPH
jgi:hypothetical protein